MTFVLTMESKESKEFSFSLYGLQVCVVSLLGISESAYLYHEQVYFTIIPGFVLCIHVCSYDCNCNPHSLGELPKLNICCISTL